MVWVKAINSTNFQLPISCGNATHSMGNTVNNIVNNIVQWPRLSIVERIESSNLCSTPEMNITLYVNYFKNVF